jgi:hypothetical protein
VSAVVAGGVEGAVVSVVGGTLGVAAAAAALVDASKPLGSLPIVDVTGVSFAVGAAAALAGGVENDGP